MAAGESSIAILRELFSAKTNLNSTLSKVNEKLGQKAQVEGQEAQTSADINTNTQESQRLDAQGEAQQNALNDYYELLSETIEKEDPLKKLYCGIGEFVIEEASMCGMGMGMGHMELNSSIKLTGAELVTLSCMLNSNADGALDAKGLSDAVNERFKELGIENSQTTSANGELILTRTNDDGSTSEVKFKDANGDVMLNGCDYDFSNALAKFNDDLKAYNDKLNDIQKNIETTAAALDQTEQEQAHVGEVLDHESQLRLIDFTQGQIEIEQSQAEALKAKMESLGLEYKEFKLEEAEAAIEAKMTQTLLLQQKKLIYLRVFLKIVI